MDQWREDAHARAAVNPRFLTMYLGTDLEGRASPYADPSYPRAATCQARHMPRGLAPGFVAPHAGGVERDPATIASHRMPGADDVELLRTAATLELEVKGDGDVVRVDVRVVNDRTGHHLPTDSPLRQVLLVVAALDERGAPLALRRGYQELARQKGWRDPDILMASATRTVELRACEAIPHKL